MNTPSYPSGSLNNDKDEEIARLRELLGSLISILTYGEHYGVRLLYTNEAGLRDSKIEEAKDFLKLTEGEPS